MSRILLKIHLQPIPDRIPAEHRVLHGLRDLVGIGDGDALEDDAAGRRYGAVPRDDHLLGGVLDAHGGEADEALEHALLDGHVLDGRIGHVLFGEANHAFAIIDIVRVEFEGVILLPEEEADDVPDGAQGGYAEIDEEDDD